jgi:pimeloyl-ACP methyl ester carboxylesterase/DNA-binding CsgD family transcriptional regulator
LIYNPAIMGAPPAQYVTTPDGYNIAYAVTGSGTPLLLTPPGFNHIQHAWNSPARREWLEGLSQRFQLVQFDFRGQGLSTRGLPESFTIADYETDIETLVDHLQLDQFVLLGTCITGHATLRFAAKHQERLQALLLLTTAVSERAWPIDLFAGLGRENWELLLWSRLAPGLSSREIESMAEITRQMMTQEDAVIRWQGSAESDVSALLPEIRTPALVMHPRDFLHLNAEEAVKLASGLPNARLTMLESDDPGDLHGRPSSALLAIDNFFAGFSTENGRPVLEKVRAQPVKLSTRQTEVLALLVRGKTNREIATELVLSLRTVERHIEELYAKLQVRNRAEAIALALGRLGEK